MLADDAASVPARRPRFGAEAWGVGGHPHRQLALFQNFLAHDVGERNFRRGDQPAAIGGGE